MTQRHLLPLEEYLQTVSSKKSLFPSITVDYFERYITTLNELEQHVYRILDGALVANTAPTDGLPGLFTAHDKSHFDEVVRYAGQLLGISAYDDSATKNQLTPYEIYLLLVAIRIHDAGNIYGRHEHELGGYRVLTEAITVPGELPEKKNIAKIARAHGGRTGVDSKDTISLLETSRPANGGSFRPRLLASIVRFADEVCESSNRAATSILGTSSIPKHSEVYHEYAASIVSVEIKYNPLSIYLEYQIPKNKLTSKFGCEPRKSVDPLTDQEIIKTEVLLIEEILDRLDKMDRERRYCNRFSRELYSVESIKATIVIMDNSKSLDDEIVDQISIVLEDQGYPESDKTPLRIAYEKYCRPEYAESL